MLIRDDLGVNISVKLRAIQIFQVGKFTEDQLGIEEARIFPQNLSVKVLRSDDPVAFSSGRSRTGTIWAEAGSKMFSIGSALDLATSHSLKTPHSRSFQPWVAGSPLVTQLKLMEDDHASKKSQTNAEFEF